MDFATSPVNNNTLLVTSETNSTLSKENDLKRKRNAYRRESREKRKTVVDKDKTFACMREYRKKGPDRNRKNHNAHMKKYRAPRLAFEKLLQAPRGGQLKIYGNIVNAPADVNSTISVLPRLPHESGTISVNLKRRLQYEGLPLSLNVRPHKVLQLAPWLLNNGSLYKGEGITLNHNFTVNTSGFFWISVTMRSLKILHRLSIVSKCY